MGTGSAAKKFVSDGKGGVKAVAAAPKADGGSKKAPAPEPSRPAPKRSASAGAQQGGKKLTYEARMRQLVPIERVRRKVAATILRFKNLSEELATWTNAADLNNEAKSVLTALEELEEVAAKMPDDFEPTRERKARESHLKAGVPVKIRAKVADSYKGIIGGEDDEVTDVELTVIDIVKGRVACKAPDGSKVFIPRGHLQVQETDEDEES